MGRQRLGRGNAKRRLFSFHAVFPNLIYRDMSFLEWLFKKWVPLAETHRTILNHPLGTPCESHALPSLFASSFSSSFLKVPDIPLSTPGSQTPGTHISSSSLVPTQE